MTISILTADPADAEAIWMLQRLAYRSEAERYQEWSIAPLTQTLEDYLAEFDQFDVLKAVTGQAIVGSVRGRLRGGTCEVGRLIVDPAFQKQGIGTRLMKRLEAAFPQAERFELFTGDRSDNTLRLYQRLGYRIFRNQAVSARLSLAFLEKKGD